MNPHRFARRRRDPRHILAQEPFRRILRAERRRAERSATPFVMLTVACRDRRGPGACVAWREVIHAIDACTRETDLAGWIEHHAAVGVVLHEVPAHDIAKPRELEVRIRRELARHLDPDIVARYSMALEVVPPSPQCEPPAVADAEETVQDRPVRQRNGFYDGLKRLFDIAISLNLLILLAPLMLVIAALVKWSSPGPVLFGQRRIGLRMKPFAMLKFRTMFVNADHALHQQYVSWFIKSSGQAKDRGDATIFKLTHDPRITRVGRVLRKTSLDELPQLWNVLRGEMSLVGPRPPLPYEVEQYLGWHTRRLTEAKPGITGLWQVGGRSRTTFDEMVRLDLRYASTCSFWTDMKILLATPGAVFSGKGAC